MDEDHFKELFLNFERDTSRLGYSEEYTEVEYLVSQQISDISQTEFSKAKVINKLIKMLREPFKHLV